METANKHELRKSDIFYNFTSILLLATTGIILGQLFCVADRRLTVIPTTDILTTFFLDNEEIIKFVFRLQLITKRQMHVIARLKFNKYILQFIHGKCKL